MVLIYGASNYPLLQLLNKEEIVIEGLQSMVGVMGMLFTIPFTAVISSILFTGRKKRAPRALVPHRQDNKTAPHNQ